MTSLQGAAESSWGVSINIFINPSPTPASEINLDTQPTLIFINSFFWFPHLFLVFSSFIYLVAIISFFCGAGANGLKVIKVRKITSESR